MPVLCKSYNLPSGDLFPGLQNLGNNGNTCLCAVSAVLNRDKKRQGILFILHKSGQHCVGLFATAHFTGTGFGANGVDPLCRYYEGTYKVEGEDDGDRCFTIAEKDGYELYIVALLNDYYLMGDEENESYDSYTERPTLEAKDKDGNQYDEAQLPDVFDAEIVSFECPEPIENTFYFTGFSGLYVVNTGVMVLVGVLTLILCMIFVRKSDRVEYRALDKIGIALNFIAVLFVLPIIYIASVFVQAYPTGPDWLYQAYLCIPQIIPFSIAASLSLRSKGFRKSGFFIQFLAPAVEVILTVLEYIL